MSDDYKSLLNEDLSGDDTSMPLLAPTTSDFTVKSCEVGTNDEGKASLHITLHSTKDLPSNPPDKQILATTFPHMTFVPLTPTEKMDLAKIRKNLATWCQCLGVATAGDGFSNWVEKTGSFKVTVQPAKGDYSASNRFRPIPIEK